MANEQTIDMGPGTYAIPLSLFRDNRLRVCNSLKTAAKSQHIDQNTFIILQGGDTINFYNTDVEYVFRQVIIEIETKQNKKNTIYIYIT